MLTGRILITLWSVFALLITMIYNSNFRVVLMSNNYEKPIVTHEDLVERGAGAFSLRFTFNIYLE